MWSLRHNIQATCHVDADSAEILPELRRNGTYTLPTGLVDGDSAGILPEFRRNGTYSMYLRVDG